MYKIVCTLLFATLTGCASNYYTGETRELTEIEKQHRRTELEQVIKKLKVGTPIRLILYNGEETEGSYYSYLDGFVTLRIDDSFRDTDIADVRAVSAKPRERIKTIMEILMIATMAGIIAEFILTH